ncbi:Trehalose-phosphatase [Metarhizium brunneum]|uniref:Trehalose-phosphatase n=1 Tax=Metarhizium brunneum TaxID=500148 RepID=A0A7D5UQE5_9HYPO|nr:Trehalose-phosphatase [Metarhizium brunneum]
MGLPGPKGASQSETHLPPHDRPSVVSVPVTPGIGRESYDQDYFERNALQSPSTTPGTDSKVAQSPTISRKDARPGSSSERRRRPKQNSTLDGNIISVTFTVPHVLEYRQDSDWELRRCYNRSALLDALHHLSDNGPHNHTVVAWTGEIRQAADSNDDAVSDDNLPITPSSTSISLGGNARMQIPPSKNVFVTRADQLRLEQQLHEDDISIVPVWLADENDMTTEGIRLHDQSRWRRYAEHDLCALLHYRQHPPSEPYSEGGRWADYCQMNQRFAQRVIETYQPEDTVIIHDYYLMLLPLLLRERCPDISVAFYLHTPFPSSELIRCLGRRQSILNGILGSDLVVFQSFHYAQHFANTCARILGLEATSRAVQTATRRVRIEVIPMGISIATVHALAWKATAIEKCALLKQQHGGKKIIVAYDPKDRLGGVDKKLLAFDRFLTKYPEYRNRVILIQVMSPTTMEADDAQEADYATGVGELVAEVNRKYGSLDYMPIQLQSQNLSVDEYFALLRSGDVALFTSVRDGMSTTSLEYVVCQRDGHGPIIISEFSGTASSLKEAIHINPWDTDGVADQIYRALNMEEEERRDIHAAVYRRVAERDVRHWATTLLRRLKRAVGARDSRYFGANGLADIGEK